MFENIEQTFTNSKKSSVSWVYVKKQKTKSYCHLRTNMEWTRVMKRGCSNFYTQNYTKQFIDYKKAVVESVT